MRCMVLVAIALTFACESSTASAQVLNHVFVEVLDQLGRSVSDLTAVDFSLQENNLDLDIVSVRRGMVRPMSIALVVDNGGRIAVPAERKALLDCLSSFLRMLPSRHEVSLYTIRGQVRRLVGPTTDRGTLHDALDRIRVGARARVGLLDSMRAASKRRYEDDEPFPVIVLVLPNGDENRDDAQMHMELQMAQLAAAGLMVHAVVLQQQRSEPGLAVAVPGVARDLAQLLCGVYMTLTSRTEWSLGLARLASRLTTGYERMSMQYRVSYVRSGAQDTQIMIGVQRPDVSVRPLPRLHLC